MQAASVQSVSCGRGSSELNATPYRQYSVAADQRRPPLCRHRRRLQLRGVRTVGQSAWTLISSSL